ncbi:ATP-binding cassette sub-family A member 13 isoform X4 [Perognathus longimembris pacificus]|uniref:ATP-binding cassette sub-family A member 13 isoform X4 n=1 Tax=Perognathus longimembris pacificus TaxID=214514 RepID=UPI00201A22A2|nr:ATP-binding cassette sub-family A member 13 isoform X4 [Perognathus longimembris pacificus]
MGQAGCQFQTLLWKNWLCRLRHPVLSLAEFFWPCILFMILIVLRFQEPPRHRDTCYLQPRDLPNQGVLSFVQGLLCNTGSSCRNFSFEDSMDHQSRLSRFQTTAHDMKINSLAFLREIQDLAEDIYETMGKAKTLQKFWEQRSETLDSSQGTSFLTMDLNKTEEVISKLEILYQKPHIWNFLLSLPKLHVTHVHVEDGIGAAIHFLQAVSNSLTSLGDLDWLRLHQTFSQVSKIVLNVTISTLTFLKQNGAVVNESVYHLSLKNIVWNPEKVQSDLKSQFGFDDLQMEHILNYSAELREIPTDGFLERMVCSALFSTSEDEAETKGYGGDCQLKWSETKNYLIHAVSWLQVYREVFDQWLQGGLLQKMFTGVRHSLEDLMDLFEEESEPQKVMRALHAALLLLSDSLAADGPEDKHPSPYIFQHLQKFQTVLHNLPWWPGIQRLQQLDDAVRNAMTQDFHFVKEILTSLETSANDSVQGGPDRWQLKKDEFFGELKQLLTKNATATCLNGHPSKEALLISGNFSILGDLWELWCHHSENKTSVLNKLLAAVEDADHILQEVINGHTNTSALLSEGHLGWTELEMQLSEVSLSCSRLFQLPKADASSVDGVCSGGCEHQLVSTVIFHILEQAQTYLEQIPYWKTFLRFIRITCEAIRYVNMQGSFQNNPMVFSEDSPCYKENMDWKLVSDNYFIFFNNLMKSPITSVSRVLNFTKQLLVAEETLHAQEDEQKKFFSLFVEFLEELLLPVPFNSSIVSELLSLTEDVQNENVLWINHVTNVDRNPYTVDTQKLLEFSEQVINKMQTLENHWMRTESKNILRFVELVLFEINPKLLELWLYGIPRGERVKLEALSTLLGFSVPENKKILSTSFNLSWLFHSDLPRPPTLNMDFVHLCETVINGLYEFGFLSQEKVFKALDTVYVLKNATDLFLALSEPQKQEVEKVLTHLYLNVFNNKDSSLLLQVYSSFYQLIYQFLSIQSRESLITYLSKISRHILDIIKQFNFQNISNAFAFLSEAAEFLGRISEVSYCQQIISIFNFLELKTQSLRSSNDKELEVIHNTLIGLKQLLVVDEDFRISLFQYMSQLFNGSEQALLNNECFIILDNLSSVNYSTNEGDFFTLPWERIFSNLSANISMFNEFMAVHCTLSWLQMWTEIWASISQIFKFELHIFPPLHVGLTQLLDELENDVNISKSCQGVFPTHHAARLILNLFKNLTQADYFHDWNSLLYLRNLWVAIDDELVTVKSLNLDQVQKSFFAMKTALHQLTSVPLKTNVSREFLYSLLEVFTKLSNPTKYMGKNVALINDYLLKNLTDYGARFESIITELRETTLFFRNVSHDQDLLSCADLFQKVIVLILEDGLSDVDNFQKAIKILAVLNSTFSSENTISALKGCITWIEVIDHIYVMSNSSFFRGSLHSTLRNLKDIENKMNSILKILTWVFNIKESLCSLNESNINCINIYLKDLADFLNIIISMVLEKEEVPEFEILLALLNDSTNQVKMIIHNLTREFDFLSQANWKHFNELLLRPIDTLDGIPSQFKNIWLHITTLGKEIQKYLQDISPAILERNSFPSMKKLFGIFSTYPKEKDIISLGNSIYHLANYFAFNLSHDLQNSSENIPHELMKSVGLGIQLMRDVFTSLMPAIHSNIPQNMAHIQVLNKITSFLPSFLKKADIELLFDQLEQISEGLVDFFKNLSRLDPDNSGVNLLIGLVEKFMASFHSWNVNHLLRLSQLFPKDEMNAVVDVYYALPRIMGLLQGIAGKTITESLKDVYNFTLLHGISTANIAKEDFATVFKTLLDIIELISDQPAIVSEALTCFPVVWCWNGTTGFQQNSRLETCNIHGFMSSFYQKFTSILEHLHLSPLGEDSQCSNESSRIEMTRKVVCVIHELVDWNSNLLNLSEVFHIQTPLVKSIQEFWYKVLPFVSYFGNQSNGSIHEACPGGPIKQVALKIIEKLKHLNFTKGTSSKNILNKLANLNKIINITTGIKISAHGNNSLNLDRIIKSISGDQSPFLFLLNANLTHSSLEAVSDFIKKTESINNFEELWVDFKQIIKDLIYNFSINHLFSEFNKEIQDINSVDFPNITLQLTQFLEILDLSSSKSLEIIEDFLQVTKNLLFVYADENYSQLIQTLLVAMDNEISTDVITVLTKVITSNWGSLKGISRENNFDIAFITHLNEEQLSNFSVVQLLLVNLLINAFNDVASSSQATAPNLGDSDLQMLNFINLTLSRLQSENGGETVFSLRSIMDFMEELLRTFSLKENSENKISFLLKDFHKDVIAEMSFISKDKIREVLKLDQFLTLMSGYRLMSFFSWLKGTIYHLIRSSFMLDSGEFSFDSQRGLTFVRDLFHALRRETSLQNETEDNPHFLVVVSELLSHVNNSEQLTSLNQNLTSVLHLVRESSTKIENLMDILSKSLNQDFHTSCLALQELVLADLTNLLPFINNSFPLRNRDTLEITKRLLDVIARADGESHGLQPFLEMSRILTMLFNGSAELRDIATHLDYAVKLLKLVKKVSGKMATLVETHFISNTKDAVDFLNIFYSVMQQSVQHLVKERIPLRKVDHVTFEKINDLLMPFLDLSFGMLGVKPNIPQDSDIFNMSSSVFSNMSQSNDFSNILEEIAEFLTSVEINLEFLERLLVVAFNNGTQIVSMGSVNLMEEILTCLVPINNITHKMDFLQLNPISSHHGPQDTIWERIREISHLEDTMLTENNTKVGNSFKMIFDLTLEALWSSLKRDNWDAFNLLWTLVHHSNNLFRMIETVVEASSGITSEGGDDLSKGFIHHQLEIAIQNLLDQLVLLRKSLLPDNSQWLNSINTSFHQFFEVYLNATTGKNLMPPKEKMMDFPHNLKSLSSFSTYMKKLLVLIAYWKKVLLTDQSVVDMCQAFQQLETSSEAMEMLQKAKMMVLHVLIIFAENPSLTKDILCATLSCKPRETKHLVLAAIQGVTAVYTHYQEIKKIWPASSQLNCESLIRNLSRTLEPFTSNLDHVTNQDCACQPPLETVEQHVHWLAKRFKESWLSGNPIMSFLSNFTVTEDVKIKDLMRNITRLTEELQSSIHISNETIHTILEANISHSQILTSALTVALSGKCDQEILHLLLTFPEDEKSWLAVKELCGLPGSEVYTLIVAMSQNLNLRTFVYKALIPPEANGLLKSLLDVISSLSSLLARAQHVFQYLPEFLHASKITALIDMPDLPQIAQNGPARSSAFGSFQTMMKLVCKDQTSFLSNSNMFINLPRVNELLEDDKEKFNIPEYSTPFCLKLYQEILQSPNGALVWSFLKPILHGKILYTPDIPEINKIIQKANYTFYFVDKLKSLSEILLKMSHFFQGSGHGQMFNQLQDALRNKFIRHFIESQLHIDVDKLTETLQTYDGMVDKMFNHTGTGHFQFLGSILVNLSSCVVLDRFQAVKSVDVLETKAHELMQQNNFLASVIFNSSLVHRHVRSASLKLPPHVTYTIRTSILYSMRTDLIKNPSWKFHPQSLPADGFKYNYIFVPLQDMIERAIIMVQTGQDALEPTTQTQAAPYPCHTSDLFLNNVGFFFPLIMMLTWMVSVASMVQKLVYEREIQIEEYMRMMGVHPTIHFLAWFLENMAVLTLSSIALAIILKTSGIFMHSDAFIIILFFLDFGVSVIMLSYFLSAFFSQANTAALCTSLVYMLSFLPYIILLVLHNQLSVAIQTLLCLLPTTAFGQGVFFITFLEGQETGIQWNNIYQAPEAGGMTFGWVCWMILIDSIIYFLCGWYLSNLIPGTFGLRKHWYFPFTASYWKNVCVLVEKRQHSLSSNLFFFNENFGNKGSTHQNKAGELKGGLPGVTLVSVNKEYEGHRLAVQDLTLTFHRGQITALLGTNGAGKTTVISMLTGLYPPTSGTIMVDGKNLQTDLPRIRMELGVCPQRDVLLDNLTVREHLLLFASIKAPWWTTKERQQQVNKTLDKVGLTNHQHKPTRALSGGMKRKLSIGIAFIGTSRTVILDEPTSGVDPCSRRSIWDILLKYREGRTIIFTTHHLDEAELLSDCVAILQQGRLRCCGPPLCLKEAYSQGLSLTLTKQCSVLEAHDAKDVARITSLIQVYVPQAFLKDSSGGELTYTIPEAADKTCFKGLFQALDQNLQHLHLTGYGISDTTLEQVFLKLLQDSNKKSHIALGTMLEPQNQRPTGPLFDYCDSPSWNPPEKNLPVCMRGHQLLLVQVTALLRRRLYHTLRAWKSTFSNLLLPVLFVALAMGLFMVQPLATTYPPLKLTPGHYERAESYFFSSGKDNMDLTHVLLRKFKDHDHHCGNLDAALKNSSRWHKDPFSSSAFQDSCGCLLQKCPNGSAPYLTNCLGHKLLNLSGFNVEEYLLQPSEKPRLGGWSFGAGVLNKVQDSRTMAKVWFNQKGFHSLPSYLNHLNNLILWRHLPSTVDWRQYGITLYSHPYGGALLNEDKILESIRQCGVALCIVLGFSVLSAWFGSSVVRDRVTGAKKLQHLSGLGYRTYWFTYFFHDMLFYLVSVSLCVAIIAAFQLTAFTFRENLAATALLLALFGYAMLPWMYLMSRIFSSPDVAFISYISLNFIFGLCTMLMTTMPKLLAIISKAQNLQNIYNVLKWVFTIFPQFCLGQGLLELCYNQIKYDLTHNFGIDSYASPFEMNFLGWIYVVLALQGTFLLLLRILLHWDLLWQPRGHTVLEHTVKFSKDRDVEKEQMRVFEGRTSGDILVLCNLSKSYRSFCKKVTAVEDVTVGIPKGECFGLLGVNGAGKSTMFKMLNGEIPPSSGHAVIRTPLGDDIDLSSAGEAGILIGYCPQQDALDDLLTGWEHLHYYCSLRGIPKQCIKEVAGDLVRRLHLEAHADKLVVTYSGGTKRKLSTALAMVGKPDILLLDEPSSGMDACSKRYLWQTIMKEVREGCAAVLTSHSMEECEALCTRLAIMVDGSFKCLGSPQHIKNRFGDGYVVKIWLSKEADQPSTISDCLKLHFPEIQFKGQCLNLLEYHVPKTWECLADLFKVLENNRTLLNIKHYSINQTTLEQVFIHFAGEQQPTVQSTPDLSSDSQHLSHLPV